MSDRLPCVVPGCTRTTSAERINPDAEWICGPHWLALPEQKRRAYNRAKRRADQGQRSGQAMMRLWRRIKAMAIERAVGI